MLAYAARRVVGMLVVLLCLVAAMFLLLHLAPGSPVNNLPPAVAADPAARAAYEHRLGLDLPLGVQFLRYIGGLLTGNMGESLYDGSSVAGQIGAHLPVSLELGFLAAVLAMVPGFAVGVWSARHRGDRLDGAMRVFTVLTLSVPAYWLALVCLVLVGQQFPQMLPTAGGYVGFWTDPLGNLTVMILPALVLSLSTFALVARSIRAALIDVLDRDYVTFARGMGMVPRLLMRRIAVRNAVIPSMTVMGVLLGGLISGTVLVENVFQIPGLGQLMVTAFLRRDYPLALGSSVVTAVIFLTLNLVVDLLYYVVDPRARAAIGSARTVTA